MTPTDPAKKGFFSSLFDFSFKTFITPTIIRIVYGIVMVLAGLAALFLVVVSFRSSAAAGVIVLLIVAPIVFLFSVILYRIFLEAWTVSVTVFVQ